MKALFYFFWLCPLLSIINTRTTNHQQLHSFLWANYMQYKKNIPLSTQWYQRAFEYSVPTHAYIGYIPFLFETEQFKKIVDLIPLLDKQFAHSASIQNIIAFSLEKTGSPQQALTRLLSLSKIFSTNQEIIFHTIQMLLLAGRTQQTIELINSYLNNINNKTNNFIFYFIKAQIHISLQQINLAYESIKQCVNLYPYFAQGWLMYALIEEQCQNIQNAIHAYLSFLEYTAEPQPQIEKHLIELAIKQKMITAHKTSIAINRSELEKALLLLAQKKYHKAVKVILNSTEESIDEKVAEKSIPQTITFNSLFPCLNNEFFYTFSLLGNGYIDYFIKKNFLLSNADIVH